MNVRRKALFLAVLPPLVLRGDVTVRYETSIETGAAAAQFRSALAPAALGGSFIRVKGDLQKATTGKLILISDLAKQRVTLLDSESKTYATIPISQYMEQVAASVPVSPQIAAQARAAAAQVKLNTAVESKMTGRTETIQGIQAEERQITVSITMTVPGAQQAALATRLIMERWTAKAEEEQRVPALAELARFNESSLSQLDFPNSLRSLFALTPGFEDAIAKMSDAHKGVVARMRLAVVPPAAMGDSPLMTLVQELKDFSTEPIPDSEFQVPPEYRATSFEEIFKTAIPALLAPAPR